MFWEVDEDAEVAPWWKCAVAALPAFLVALEFLLVLLQKRPLFGSTARELTDAMKAEFLVLHSMAFLGALGLWRPENILARLVRALAFWGLFALYSWLASSAGRTTLVVFVSLTFVTYFGLFMTWRSPWATVQLGARWFGGFVLFMTAAGYYDTPSDVTRWTNHPEVLRAGLLYFFLLAAVEMAGLYLRYVPRIAASIAPSLHRG